MRHLRRPLSALATLALVLLSACATGRGMNEAEGESNATATVVVNNNLAVPTSLTVSILPETGVRRLLGSVAPGRTVNLSYNGSVSPGRYRLYARTTSGNELISDPFGFAVGARVTWDIQSNIIRVSDQ